MFVVVVVVVEVATVVDDLCQQKWRNCDSEKAF